jgi:hypothetical protein
LGRILSNGITAKPSREVRVGDMLQVKNEGGEFQIEVLVLSEIRGPSAVAQTLFRETEASKHHPVPGRTVAATPLSPWGEAAASRSSTRGRRKC